MRDSELGVGIPIFVTTGRLSDFVFFRGPPKWLRCQLYNTSKKRQFPKTATLGFLWLFAFANQKEGCTFETAKPAFSYNHRGNSLNFKHSD